MQKMSQSKLSKFLLPLLFLISQFLNTSNSQTTPAECHLDDKNILLKIKTTLGNPNSLRSWDPNTDCCTHWLTVQCNDQGRVYYITFNKAHDIHGPIPPYLDELPWLTELYFINVTNLSGPVPSYLSRLTNLTAFVIWGTKVNGSIPDFLGRYTNLVQLNLVSNKFSGPIPESLGQLKKLLYLILYDNRLTGPIPPALARLTTLADLSLGKNKLSGPIPDFLSSLVNVFTIVVDSNNFFGPIPSYLGHMPKLSTLSMSNNQLTGPIPESWGRGNLEALTLDNNRLSGNASFLFEKENTLMFEIDISYNFFEFDFTNVDLGPNIVEILISHNMIYGSLPKKFGQVLDDSVDVSYNQLCGQIPDGEKYERVDPSLFAHNKCLCGGPLPTCK